MKKSTKRLTLLALAVSCSLILSYIEAVLPPVSALVPGIKIGLANIVSVFVLYRLSLKDAVAVTVVRLVLAALMFGNMSSFFYSAAGAGLSLAVMALLKKSNLFSCVGVSVAGGVCHNLGQICVAMLLLKTAQIGYYMIVLSVTGSVAGAFVGLAGAQLLKAGSKIKFKEK